MKYKLKEIFDLHMGKTPSRNNAEYWNSNEYKWISIADLSKTGKYIRDTKEHLSKQAIDESGIKLIPANTVRGSVVEIFTDLSVWMGIRKVIDMINANAVA